MNVPSPTALNRILETASALFAKSGYDAVSMHAIAERAGVSKANVFHHFGSKQALYNATLNFVCQKSIERVEASLQADGSYAERLRKWLIADIVQSCPSDSCRSSRPQSIVRPSSRGGVPVLSRASGRPRARSCTASSVAARSPTRPPAQLLIPK